MRQRRTASWKARIARSIRTAMQLFALWIIPKWPPADGIFADHQSRWFCRVWQKHSIYRMYVRPQDRRAENRRSSRCVHLFRAIMSATASSRCFAGSSTTTVTCASTSMRAFINHAYHRIYQYSSWLDSAHLLWIGRRKQPGRGEDSSGLRFDLEVTTQCDSQPSKSSSPPPHSWS